MLRPLPRPEGPSLCRWGGSASHLGEWAQAEGASSQADVLRLDGGDGRRFRFAPAFGNGPGQAGRGEGDDGPRKVSLSVGDEAFVIAAVSSGADQPRNAALHHPAFRLEDEAFDLRPVDCLQGELELLLGPGDEFAAVGGVRPDQGDLRVCQLEADEEVAGGVGVVNVSGSDHHHHGGAAQVDREVPLPSVDLLPGVIAAGRFPTVASPLTD